MKIKSLLLAVTFLSFSAFAVLRPDSLLNKKLGHVSEISFSSGGNALSVDNTNENFFLWSNPSPVFVDNFKWDSSLENIFKSITGDLVVSRKLGVSFVSVAQRRTLEQMTGSKQATYQVLLSEEGGVGATTLVEKFSKAAGRPVLAIQIAGQDGKAVVESVRETLQATPNAIILLDNLGRLETADLKTVQTLFILDKFFPEVSFVLNLGFEDLHKVGFLQAAKPLYNLNQLFTLGKTEVEHEAAVQSMDENKYNRAEILKKLFENASSVHVMRAPSSPEEYLAIINKLIERRLAQGRELPGAAKALSPEKFAQLKVLVADIAFKTQGVLGRSQVKQMSVFFNLDNKEEVQAAAEAFFKQTCEVSLAAKDETLRRFHELKQASIKRLVAFQTSVVAEMAMKSASAAAGKGLSALKGLFAKKKE